MNNDISEIGIFLCLMKCLRQVSLYRNKGKDLSFIELFYHKGFFKTSRVL